MRGIAFVAGFVMVAVGTALIFVPAGLIVGGIALSGVSYLSFRGSDV